MGFEKTCLQVSQRRNLIWADSVSLLVLFELFAKLNSKWHVCNGNHVYPDTIVNYSSSLGIVGWSKGVPRQTQLPSVFCQWLPWVIMAVATSALWILQAMSCDCRQLQPRKSQEDISTSLAGNSASASLLVVGSWLQGKSSVTNLWDFPSALLSTLFFHRANLVLLLLLPYQALLKAQYTLLFKPARDTTFQSREVFS